MTYPSEKLIRTILAFCIAGVLSASISNADDKPNIIIIITDDQGYNDVGFNGSEEIPTPNVDRIADEGVRFTQAYVTHPFCGPSRAGLLSGRYQYRFGFEGNPSLNPRDEKAGFPTSEEMISEMLKRAGYTNMIAGKWHMGTHPRFHPFKRGFDEFFGFLAGGHQYFPHELTVKDMMAVKNKGEWYRTKLRHNGEIYEMQRDYLTDEISDFAVDFIERRGKQDEPFFLYLAYNAPHGPLQATQTYLDRFPNIEDNKRRTYAAMISAVDDGVGRVLDTLDQMEIAGNTVVFFLSDNGGVMKKGKENWSDNSPLRAGKGSFFEGGNRVPFAMRWPARVKAKQDYNEPISSLDIASTLAAHLNIQPQKTLDGIDLLPYLNGVARRAPDRELYWRNLKSGNIAVVSGDYKYMKSAKNSSLFDLSSDIGESKNLVKKNAEVVGSMESKQEDWLEGMATEPAFNFADTWPRKN
ncbi:MAG: sulfatase-like hydrolase/transferase [Verrucomicrobiota bacterium]